MWPCAMSGVSEPVAVEVGEERLGLACVRVTVEHSSYKMAPRTLRTLSHSHTTHTTATRETRAPGLRAAPRGGGARRPERKR